MHPELRQIADLIGPLLRRSGVRSAAVFGSTARGEAGPDSDLDLLVEFGPGVDLLDAAGLKLELEACLSRPVDLVTRAGLKPALAPRILKDCVAIL